MKNLRKQLEAKLEAAFEALEIAKIAAASSAEAVAEFEAAHGFFELLASEAGAWVLAAAKASEEALTAAKARFEAAEEALVADRKAARERRWNGLVKSGGAEAWRENYNTDGRNW